MELVDRVVEKKEEKSVSKKSWKEFSRQFFSLYNNRYKNPCLIYLLFYFSLICYRISVIFRVRSAKAVKITDMNLLKRLGVIVTIFSVFLMIRTLVAPPVVIVGRTADDLKAYLCQTDWWDHSFTTRKYRPRNSKLFHRYI